MMIKKKKEILEFELDECEFVISDLTFNEYLKIPLFKFHCKVNNFLLE